MKQYTTLQEIETVFIDTEQSGITCLGLPFARQRKCHKM